MGGIGIAPVANINCVAGHTVFEATHGTAPKYASQDKANPGSVILSDEMMLRYMGWNEAANTIIHAMNVAMNWFMLTPEAPACSDIAIRPQPVGSLRMNIAPPSARRRASKRAPCSWAMRATIASPRPVPRGLVLR